MYTLPEVMELDMNKSCAAIMVQKVTENVTGTFNHDMDAALDYSTALDVTQEYSTGELMVIAPITTTIEDTDCGTVAPHSEKTSPNTRDLASVHSQLSVTLTESNSAESETPKYKKIYYSCLMPQEDDIIYIHYRDIISRPCAVKLLKMTQQEIEMFTSI